MFRFVRSVWTFWRTRRLIGQVLRRSVLVTLIRQDGKVEHMLVTREAKWTRE